MDKVLLRLVYDGRTAVVKVKRTVKLRRVLQVHCRHSGTEPSDYTITRRGKPMQVRRRLSPNPKP